MAPVPPAAAPTISSITAPSGHKQGGTPVTISGTGFNESTTVRIGGDLAETVTVSDSSTITAFTPSHSLGELVDVVVTNSNNLSDTLTAGYMYYCDGEDSTTCEVGERGPGGGFVYYVSATPFPCGPTRAQMCAYLELTPAGWYTGGDPTRTWAQDSPVDYQRTLVNNAGSPEMATANEIGWGYRNTQAIILQGNTNTATSAAALADSYAVTNSGVEYDDWYLPSKDELNQMCKWARGQAWISDATVCDNTGTLNSATYGASSAEFVDYLYWSSSETMEARAWNQFFRNGDQGFTISKNYTFYVRPIRAFGSTTPIIKTVSIGSISGSIQATVAASGITYPVTSANIADGQTGSVTWYDALTGGSTTTEPTGITISAASTLATNAMTLNVTVDENTIVAGDYYFTVTIDSVESARKTLTVSAPPDNGGGGTGGGGTGGGGGGTCTPCDSCDPCSTDATLSSATVKGQSATLGNPITDTATALADFGSITPGSVNLTWYQANDVSSLLESATAFIATESVAAQVHFAKYPSGTTDFSDFETRNFTDAETITSGDFFIVRVIPQDPSTTPNYYIIVVTVDAPPSRDASLSTSSKVKGVVINNLGIPNSDPASVTPGFVVVSAEEAADTTNDTSFVTEFIPNDVNANTRATLLSNFGPEYNPLVPLTDGETFGIAVTAQDNSVLYYSIKVLFGVACNSEGTRLGTGDPCQVGDIGPGGGYIFYNSQNTFTSSAPCLTVCKYLEVAPVNWYGPNETSDPGLPWSINYDDILNIANEVNDLTPENLTSAAIGLGFYNSEEIVSQNPSCPTVSGCDYAAGAARAYAGGGKNDWYLPVVAELTQLCKYVNARPWISDETDCGASTSPNPSKGLSGYYWSSSEWDLTAAWAETFNNTVSVFSSYGADSKERTFRVRPIRAFGKPCYTVVNNVITNGGSCSGALVIPNTITGVGDNAFNARGLTSLSFETNSVLETIGDHAFAGIATLGNITIPASVKSIEYAAFTNTNITALTFASGSLLETISAYAFEGTIDIKRITIPANVVSIGERAFSQNFGLICYINLSIVTDFVGIFGPGIVKPTCNSLAAISNPSTSTVKSVVLSSLGIPFTDTATALANLNSIESGTVALTFEQANDVSGLSATSFLASDAAGADVHFAKYASTDTDFSDFESRYFFDTETVSDGDLFIVRVTALDPAAPSNYYVIGVSVNLPPLLQFDATGTPVIVNESATVLDTVTVNQVVVASGYQTTTPSAESFTFQWESSTTLNGTYEPIVGATNETFTPTSDLVASFLHVVVTASAIGYVDTRTASIGLEVFAAPSTSQTYAIGDPGPGGGIVYYYNPDGFNCGANFTSTGSPTGGLCYYLEVAPSGWSGESDPTMSGAVPEFQSVLVPGIAAEPEPNNTFAGIGLGYLNSLNIIAQNGAYDSTTNKYAAGSAHAYSGNGKTDWYLPSEAELNALCQWDNGEAQSFTTECRGLNPNSAINGALLAGFDGSGCYLSSSQLDAQIGWCLYFDGQGHGVASKSWDGAAVRPIRAFGNGIPLAPALTITSITANIGPKRGGTAVTISGAGFTESTTVRFAGSLADTVTVSDSSTITAFTPSHSFGERVDVVVTNSDNQSETSTAGYMYYCDGESSTTCAVGERGPGGGIVYYADLNGFTCGATLANTCSYLEVAPNGWNNAGAAQDDPTRSWAQMMPIDYQNISVGNDVGDTATATALGWGYRNSLAIIAQGNDNTSASAAALAQTYSGGEKTDWYLPSKDELNELIQWDLGVSNSSGLSSYYYWSSSEAFDSHAFYQSFDDVGGDAKRQVFSVRSIRAFGNSAPPPPAPVFTLSASTESVSRLESITGFTPVTSDSSILRYEILPAPVAGLTFETTTGILSGTPTQNLIGETYTITAFNTSESATAIFVLTVNGISCDGTSFDCAVGDRGPGNGIVFYVHAAGTFAESGTDCDTTCKYLEVAPAGWYTGSFPPCQNLSSDPSCQWLSSNFLVGQDTSAGSEGGFTYEQFNWAFGQGFYNTSLMAGPGLTSEAKDVVIAYGGSNGSTGQWFIPSMNELNELCKYARGQVTGEITVQCTSSGSLKSDSQSEFGGFDGGHGYWSSSQMNYGIVWYFDFNSGGYNGSGTAGYGNIRPIRAF